MKTKTEEILIPITTPTGKFRAKTRLTVNEYGLPAKTRQNIITKNVYIEGQYTYDKKLTKDETDKYEFVNSKGDRKKLDGLSLTLLNMFKKDIVLKSELEELKKEISSYTEKNYVENSPEFQIQRDSLKKTMFNGMSFQETKVSYPLLIYKFENSNVIAEIIIKEKQRAVGIQPMLYLCIPILDFENGESYLNRIATTKEFATYVINENNKKVIIDNFKLLASLSASHNSDIKQILDIILKSKTK